MSDREPKRPEDVSIGQPVLKLPTPRSTMVPWNQPARGVPLADILAMKRQIQAQSRPLAESHESQRSFRRKSK